jgi:hypothetical protein
MQQFHPMGHGICCANFSSPRGSWNQCRGAWCADHCAPTTWDKHPLKESLEENGMVVIHCLRDKNNFLRARNGDCLMVPFQCCLCHFRNMKDRDPFSSDHFDCNLLTAICRANLDSFWGRAASTVSNNLSSTLNVVWTMREKHRAMGTNRCFPPQGPHLIADTFGTFAACVMLEHPLNPGINRTNVQFGAIRKTRSCLTNCSNETVAELMEPVLVGGLKGVRFNFGGAQLCSIGSKMDAICAWAMTFVLTRLRASSC